MHRHPHIECDYARNNMNQPYEGERMIQIQKSIKRVVIDLCNPEEDSRHCNRLNSLKQTIDEVQN